MVLAQALVQPIGQVGAADDFRRRWGDIKFRRQDWRGHKLIEAQPNQGNNHPQGSWWQTGHAPFSRGLWPLLHHVIDPLDGVDEVLNHLDDHPRGPFDSFIESPSTGRSEARTPDEFADALAEAEALAKEGWRRDDVCTTLVALRELGHEEALD